MSENDLPKGWKETTLKGLCNMVYGKGLLTKDLTEEGFPVYGANGIIGKYPSYIYEESQIIISCRGAASGAIHKTVPKSYVTSNSIVLQLKDDEIPLDYLKYVLLSVDKTQIVTGSAQPQITIENLNNLSFPLPPLAEQERIVAKLDALFAKIDSNKQRLEKIPQLLKRFKQSVLAAAVSGKLTEEWRKENGVEFNFENKTLDEVTTKITDGEHQTPKRQSDGEMMLSAKNVRDGYIDYSDFSYISTDDFNKSLKRCNPEVGDTLLVCVGATIGRAAMITENKKFSIVRSVALIKPDSNLLRPKFLIFSIQSNIIQNQIQENLQGSAQPSLFLNRIKQLRLQLPIIAEQEEIVKRVEQLFAFADKLEARYNKAKAMLDKLPQSLLAKAFRGELVPQNENDEPASVLLERIKKERLLTLKPRKRNAN